MTGFIDHYEISNTGRVVRIVNRVTRRTIKWCRHSAGYPEITPCIQGKPKRKLLHHVMTETFIGDRPEGLIVNHIDGWKWNPRVSNLEYVTPRGNYDHATKTGLVAHGNRCKQALLDDAKVREIRKNGTVMTGKAIADILGVNPGTVYAVLKGKTWKRVD